MRGLLYTAIFILGLTACSKSEDGTPSPNIPQPTKKELLTAKAWKYAAWTVTPPIKDTAGVSVSDVLHYKPACEQDDIIIFYTNGNVSFDQGATQCDPTQPQSVLNTWALLTNDTEISIGGNKYRVDLISADSMKWSFDDWQGSTKHLHSIVFAH